MEFFRRLRIIWTALCTVAAVLVALGHMGNPNGVPLTWFFAAVAAAVAFHIDGSWRVKLSVLWFGGVGLLSYGALTLATHAGRDADKALTQVVALIVGTWCVAAALTWLVGGLRNPKNTS